MKVHPVSDAPIQVLVVDDSAIVRGLLTRALESDSNIKVAGSAMHGEAALAWMRKYHADVVLLDVEMPVLNGFETLRQIQIEHPGKFVIMVSGLTYSGAKTTLQALRLGAVGCVAKPEARSVAEAVALVARELVPMVRGLVPRRVDSETKTVISKPVTRKPVLLKKRSRLAQSIELVVVGCSTGGPRALERFVKDLPHDFDLPICIVQHMPPFFTPMLAKHLEADSGRRACEAQTDMLIEPRRIYVAPGDFHFTLALEPQGLVAKLNQDPPEHFCRPSVNPLFRSAAHCCGGGLIAVMLTGMGNDGVEATADIHRAGGHIIAQDEATSVVWGMPGAIARAGLVHQLLPIQQIGAAVGNAVRKAPQGVLK